MAQLNEIMTKEAIKPALIRFARTIIPQIPTLLSVLNVISPKYTALWVFVGAIITALDKYLRDVNAY